LKLNFSVQFSINIHEFISVEALHHTDHSVKKSYKKRQKQNQLKSVRPQHAVNF